MKRRASIAMVILIVIVSALSAQVEPANSALQMMFPSSYRITASLTLKKSTLDLSKAVDPSFLVVLPLPSSNAYQEISDLRVSTGEVVCYEGKQETYLRYSGRLPPEKIEITFTVGTRKAFPLWERITQAIPYDAGKPGYAMNTLRDDGRIQADDPIIEEAATRIRSESKDVLDYVRRADVWEQKTLAWKMDGKQKSIAEIFTNVGGECSALSTVLISLLRNNGIPSRYNSGFVFKDGIGASHAWTEFYLEGYGWFPIDAAFRGGFDGDPIYVGYYDGQRVIFSQGSDYVVNDLAKAVPIGNAQRFFRRSIKGGTLPGTFEYNDMVYSIKVLRPSEDSSYYNQSNFVKSVRSGSLGIINERRRQKGLPPFERSEELDQVAQDYLGPLNGVDPLERSGLKFSYSYRWKMAAVYPTLDPARKFSVRFPWDRLEDPKMNRLGIGCSYEAGIQNFYFVLIKTK